MPVLTDIKCSSHRRRSREPDDRHGYEIPGKIWQWCECTLPLSCWCVVMMTDIAATERIVRKKDYRNRWSWWVDERTAAVTRYPARGYTLRLLASTSRILLFYFHRLILSEYVKFQNIIEEHFLISWEIVLCYGIISKSWWFMLEWYHIFYPRIFLLWWSHIQLSIFHYHSLSICHMISNTYEVDSKCSRSVIQ